MYTERVAADPRVEVFVSGSIPAGHSCQCRRCHRNRIQVPHGPGTSLFHGGDWRRTPVPTALAIVAADPLWSSFKGAYFDKLINQLGINAVRIDITPGDIENDADYFTAGALGAGPFNTWCCSSTSHAQKPVNDNNDPNHFNCPDQTLVNCPNTFPFAENDYMMGNWITGDNGFVATARAAYKYPFIQVTYNPRSNVTFVSNDCAELGEQFAALFLHDQNKWGVIPDAIDMINEPDINGGTNWTAAKVGACAKVVKNRLNSMGSNPRSGRLPPRPPHTLWPGIRTS